uniref:Uncharacterized protein n=1 Tax=Anguilla anguilla TaxID=7936 RepID=A0A0E9XAA1_ANGAN
MCFLHLSTPSPNQSISHSQAVSSAQACFSLLPGLHKLPKAKCGRTVNNSVRCTHHPIQSTNSTQET